MPKVTDGRLYPWGKEEPTIEGFAELLGGSISVESQLEKGSMFTVRIPANYQGH